MAAAVARPHGGEMGVEGERGGEEQEEERAGSGTAEPPTRRAARAQGSPARSAPGSRGHRERGSTARRLADGAGSRDHRGTGEHRLHAALAGQIPGPASGGPGGRVQHSAGAVARNQTPRTRDFEVHPE
ncbi:unnamed protein product, partial [Prorocentrum cordatum]